MEENKGKASKGMSGKYRLRIKGERESNGENVNGDKKGVDRKKNCDRRKRGRDNGWEEK